MPKRSLSAYVLSAAFIIAGGLLAVPDQVSAAQAVRYVAAGGSNANNCQRATPCQTLQRGINVTPAGGELVILDSGAYGPSATIGKSITISAIGVAAIVGTITVDAPSADVTLRGLTLNGLGAGGGSGITVTAAASVQVIDCLIERFATRGIYVTATAAQIFIKDTTVRRNVSQGILVNIAQTFLTVDDSTFELNGTGISIAGFRTRATIADTTISGNTGYGIINTDAEVVVDDSVITNNGIGGLRCFGNAGQQILMVSNSSISGNATYGLVSLGTCMTTINGSSVSNNGRYGMHLIGMSETTVLNSTVELNGRLTGGGTAGIRCEEGAALAIDSSTVAQNNSFGIDGQANCRLTVSRSYFDSQSTDAFNLNSTNTSGDSLFDPASGLFSGPNTFDMIRD